MDTGSIPWVEKYRPDKFEDIVLDDNNKQILTNILKKKYFPNMLFYGPPGTGKTTTIMSLINKYQEENGEKNKGLMIHLNASDERGIDTIRSQISNFVNAKTLFGKGIKFVIFDEVDYMTKNAQQALRYLLQDCTENVRFCLIGNYISRIDEALQNEFVRLKFNQLPKHRIFTFLRSVSEKENLKLNEKTIKFIQELYGSDIRSMINFMQTNQDIFSDFKIINNEIWEQLNIKIKKGESIETLSAYIELLSIQYNIDKINLLKDYINYIILNKNFEQLSSKLLFSLEHVLHNSELNVNYSIVYSLLSFLEA